MARMSEKARQVRLGTPSSPRGVPDPVPRPAALASISPRHIRYIKLGRKGQWADECFAQGEMWFGHRLVPHEMCLGGEWKRVTRLYMDEGRTRRKAQDFTRELQDFYELGDDCLWITFAKGQLWWTFAHPEVLWLGSVGEGKPSRLRKSLGGWCASDVAGEPLCNDHLSTKLTQTAAYRQTICKVHDSDYLIRKINGLEEPLDREALVAKAQLSAVAQKMIKRLHWADFEVLVDLIFSRSGWQRISRVGGDQKDVDIVLEQPTTGEKAFVQIKSKAGKKTLAESLERFRERGLDRFYFVCHSPTVDLCLPAEPNLHLWTGASLAEAVIKAGLFDWLMEAVG